MAARTRALGRKGKYTARGHRAKAPMKGRNPMAHMGNCKY